MARKPNYAFERNNKAKAKAEKREAKRLAKLAGKNKEATDQPSEEADTQDSLTESQTSS